MSLGLLLTAATLLAFLPGGLVQADSVPGEVSNVRLLSNAPGSLTISWDAPAQAPNDYRVMWARADRSYLSYRFENESLRGNSYPDGSATSLTLTGLTKGAEFKIQLRSRYESGGGKAHPWSGPWTEEAERRVRGDAPDVPTGLSANETTSKGKTSITFSWIAPSHDGITGYRIRRGADADSLTVLARDTGDTATTYNDATTRPGNSYVYTVTALSVDGDSPRSTTASVTRSAEGPRNEPTPVPTPIPTPEPQLNPPISKIIQPEIDDEEFPVTRQEPVQEATTAEPAGADFSFDSLTLGRLRLGEMSTGILSTSDDNSDAHRVWQPRGGLFKLENVVPGRSYRVRAWFGTSKDDSATAERGGSISLKGASAGSGHVYGLGNYFDDLLDDGLATFAFLAHANEDYYLAVISPAYAYSDGIFSAYDYYGPYMLEMYNLGPTQQPLSVTGQSCNTDNRICTGGTITYSEGYGVKGTNLCINNRCFNDPRFIRFHMSAYATNETHFVSVGNNPVSKNLVQSVGFRAGPGGSPTAKFKLDGIEAFVHDMTGGSVPRAAIHADSSGSPGDKLFDLEPIMNDDGHFDRFLAPATATALIRGTSYWVVFSEGGGSNASYKLYATTQTGEDDDTHVGWPIDDTGQTRNAGSGLTGEMRPPDSSNTLVTLQISIYAGVAPSD